MKILINLATLKAGGGQNVGLNFLNSLLDIEIDLKSFYFVVAKDSELENFLISNNIYTFTSVSNNPIIRILFELTYGSILLKREKIDVIYTLFGIGLYPRCVKQVSGSADSNIFYPEIFFWQDYKGFKLIYKKIVDLFRIYALKRADAVIFENLSLLKRAKELYQIQNAKFIKPSISINFDPRNLDIVIPKDVYVGLFFCGWQKNKNYQIIPYLASEFKKRGIKFHFILTAPLDNSLNHITFIKSLKENDVADMVSVVGFISKGQIPSLYKLVDFVFLLSKLESFSNNIIESWYFNKPLIVSKEEWAISICDDAAIYVNRNDSLDIVNSVKELILNNDLLNNIINNGQKKLSTYPSVNVKTIEELLFLKEIYENT